MYNLYKVLNYKLYRTSTIMGCHNHCKMDDDDVHYKLSLIGW